MRAIAREISVLTDLPTVLDRVNNLTAAALRCDFSTTLLIDARACRTRSSGPTRAISLG